MAERDAHRALSCPRVHSGSGKSYFLAPCPHCDDGDAYHHLDTPPQGPDGQLTLCMAWCEDCGVVDFWKVLGGLSDGSVRVLGPDFGSDPPPMTRK